MALKATIFKAELQVADMDRQVYGDRAVTIARHPSETDERMMVRLAALALFAPSDDRDGALDFSRGLSDADEPALWQHDLTGQVMHWIDIGQPDERRLQKAASRSARVTVIAHASSTPVWWKALQPKLNRLPQVAVWSWPAEATQALAALAQRTMRLNVTVQDGTVWMSDGEHTVEWTPEALQGGHADR